MPALLTGTRLRSKTSANPLGGGAVTIATYDSRAAGNGAATAFVPKAWTLSVVAGALDLLETDEVTIAIVKGGSGQVLTGRINITGKAI